MGIATEEKKVGPISYGTFQRNNVFSIYSNGPKADLFTLLEAYEEESENPSYDDDGDFWEPDSDDHHWDDEE